MKKIPIRFFSHREKDNSIVEGRRGSNDDLKWIKPPQKLKEHSSTLERKIFGFRSRFQSRSRFNSELPLVIRVSIIDAAIAKSYRGNISSLFSIDETNTIGFDSRNDILVKIRDQDLLERILTNFEDVERNKVGLSAVKSFIIHEPNIKFDSTLDPVAKIKLFNYQDDFLNFKLLDAFDNFCRFNEFKIKKQVNYGENLFIYALEGVGKATLDSLKKFDGIFQVSNMPLYEPEKPESKIHESIPLRVPDEKIDYPIVGVLDSGIEENKYLRPWLVKERKVTHYKAEDVDSSHGTSVSSILLYGNELEGEKEANGACKILDATVFPNIEKQKIFEHELIYHIERTITENKDIKNWNLSLGTNTEIDPYRFSDFAIALDNIQKKYGVLICTSVGNCENFKKDKPNGKISESGDSVLSLVVGSLAHKKDKYDLSEVNHPSPFTRFGPGPANIIKPDLVHLGGNVGYKDGNYINNGVMSLTPDGYLTENVGTSFSTPRITSLAANLSHNIDLDFDPVLIKGLIIHTAKHPKEVNFDIETKVEQMGYGLPAKISNILYNDEDEITLVMRESIAKGAYIEILDFPFPQSMIDNDGRYYGKIVVTLITNPILESSQGVEYCQSDLEIKFGTYDYLEKTNMNDPYTKNPFKKINNKNLLLPNLYSKRKIKKASIEFANERILLDKFKKYQPVKKWALNLEELTEGNANKYLPHPKKWFLQIRPLFRNFTEVKAALQNIILKQDFCLFITISDPKKKGLINSEVTKNLGRFEFPNSELKIKEYSETANIK